MKGALLHTSLLCTLYQSSKVLTPINLPTCSNFSFWLLMLFQYSEGSLTFCNFFSCLVARTRASTPNDFRPCSVGIWFNLRLEEEHLLIGIMRLSESLQW